MKNLFITLIMMLVTSMANAQCPDNNHPHAIDLGLPSGTKWACCNVGATTPEGFGNYYAWGETKEKEKYDWASYIYCDGTMETCHDIGSDIAGTEYDVAHVLWGKSWEMPTHEQIQELVSNCSCTWTTINEVGGHLFTGPNGRTVFLPESDYWREPWDGNDVQEEDDYLLPPEDMIPNNGSFWSSTRHTSKPGAGYCLHVSYGEVFGDFYNYRDMGLTVRPVTSGIIGQPVRGDMDGDGRVSIKDVMDIIDIILTGKE